MDHSLNFSSLPKSLLHKGLQKESPEGTLCGLSAVLQRPVVASDVLLLRDIIQVFKEFPGTVMGADTPAKVLRGKHSQGKKLGLYGAYASSEYSQATIKNVADEVHVALHKVGAVIPGSKEYGPDHTFVPTTKDPTKFDQLLKFVTRLPKLPELPVASLKKKLTAPSGSIPPLIEDIRAKIPFTFNNLDAIGDLVFGPTFVGLASRSEFVPTTLLEVILVRKTAFENVTTITIGEEAAHFHRMMAIYHPVINVAINRSGTIKQWDAGWMGRGKYDKKFGEMVRDSDLENQLEAIPALTGLRTPEISLGI